MTNTTNYNLLLAEGTDLVNYLTQTNPNFSNLDTIIKGVSDLTVTPATEVTTGTAHAISKTLADATVIKFTATSNWQTGDTMTLDGNPVTPLKTDGTTLKTGDYIIGSAVLMIQDGTRLTVLVASSPDAGDINYTNDGTHTWLTANKVEGAINEAAAEIDNINSNLSASLTSTGLSFVNCSYNDGGYAKFGNLCVVNIRVTQTQGTGFRIDGFPTYRGSYNKVCLSGINANTQAVVNGGLGSDGQSIFNATGTDVFMISGCYVC